MESNDRNRFVAIIAAAAVLSAGLILGLFQVGGGLASRASNAITVTGTASENATADNAVWTLNLNESQPTLASSVKKIDASADALKKYLLTGGIATDQIELGNYGPAYYLSTLDDMRAKLLAAAMKDAQARAKAITEAVGGSVGPLLSVSSGPTQVTTKNSLDRAAGGVYDVSTIEKTVNVTLSASFKSN